MKIEDVERAHVLVSVIKQAQNQIEKYESLRAVKEIALIANSTMLLKLMDNEKAIYSKDDPAPMYYTGDTKNKMIDVLISATQIFLNARLEALEKL